MSGSSVSSPRRLCAWRARSVASLVVVAGRRRRGTCAARLTAGGDDLPVESGAVEAVGEVVAVGLAGRRVQPERVQRPAVIGELGLAARAGYRAELAGQTAGTRVGKAGGKQ